MSYCISVGLADKVSWYFSHVQGPLDNDMAVVDVILAAMRLISALANTLAVRLVHCPICLFLVITGLCSRQVN